MKSLNISFIAQSAVKKQVQVSARKLEFKEDDIIPITISYWVALSGIFLFVLD